MFHSPFWCHYHYYMDEWASQLVSVLKSIILKHLRQFVQSDWFLPVLRCLYHTIKTRRRMFAPRTHLAGLIH